MNELGHKYYQIALLESTAYLASTCSNEGLSKFSTVRFHWSPLQDDVKHIMLSGQVVDAILLILAVLVVVADYENIVIY